MDGYYIWLTHLIETKSNLAREHRKLLTELYWTEFVWSIRNDDNRACDGLGLRERYSDEVGSSDAVFEHLDGNCSVLEMMIALADRMEIEIQHDDEYGDRTPDWFWNMVNSLGLMEAFDDNFDLKIVQETIDIFLTRKYGSDGFGSIFALKEPVNGYRKMEIWYQMSTWICQNFV